MKRVTVVDHGAGNIASVVRALRHVGADVALTADPAQIAGADRIVVPGQGAFPDAMRRLAESGLDDAIRAHVARERPYFGICLGLQLLFDRGMEHVETPGLGVLRGACVPLSPSPGAKIPHMGWNAVTRRGHGRHIDAIADGEHFYFVHSFVVVPAEPLAGLVATHGAEFTAAVERGTLFACQFHPEKSQQAGLALLQRFVEAS